MTDKAADKKQWTDPSDYGLPFVEVVPLKHSYVSKKVEERAVLLDVAEVKKRTIQLTKPVFSEIEPEEDILPRAEQKVEEKKSSKSWMWIVAILTLAVVIVIIWQMNKSVTSSTDSEAIVSESIEGLASQENDEVAINSTPSEETQTLDSQSNISDSISSVDPAVQTPQTGTTIASKQSGTLIRVEGKADRPYFYVIVGSLPNEAMAIQEARQYMDRTDSVYLILPYEDVTNYRLAIAGSVGFTAMTEELARVKGQYTEELWILKY